MSDSKTNKDSRDRTHVNVNEDYELRYWCEKWNVTPDELRGAVAAAGTAVSKVEAYLKR